MREIIISLPEPLSVNNLIRMSYHLRNARREMLKRAIAEQLTREYGAETKKRGKEIRLANWRPLRFCVADAIFTLRSLRDDFELPASLKIEMDALQELGVIHSDAPTHFVRGTVAQKVGSARGVKIRLRELESAPEQPRVDF